MVLSHMYGTILEGRLQILVVNLQEFSEFLDIDDGEKRQENFLPDSFQDLGHVELRETLFELLEKNGLGNRERKNLQRGFDYLYEALVLIRSLPAGKVNVLRYVSQDDRLKLQYLLTRSIEAFETVRRGQFPDGFFLPVLLTACFSACHDRFLPVFDTGNNGITIDIPFWKRLFRKRRHYLFIDKARPGKLF